MPIYSHRPDQISFPNPYGEDPAPIHHTTPFSVVVELVRHGYPEPVESMKFRYSPWFQERLARVLDPICEGCPAPGSHWVGDVTYVRLVAPILYLSKELVGRNMVSRDVDNLLNFFYICRTTTFDFYHPAYYFGPQALTFAQRALDQLLSTYPPLAYFYSEGGETHLVLAQDFGTVEKFMRENFSYLAYDLLGAKAFVSCEVSAKFALFNERGELLLSLTPTDLLTPSIADEIRLYYFKRKLHLLTSTSDADQD